MRVFIAGIDGYIGWPLALHLIARGHQVSGMDNFSRRKYVEECGSCSAIPILEPKARFAALFDATRRVVPVVHGTTTDYNTMVEACRRFKPEAIVYLAEIPSAPFSMQNVHAAVTTQYNNVIGTLVTLHAMHEACPEAHLVKLGTMGEYGTPNVDIPEGYFEVTFRGRVDTMLFPRQAGSWYHQSKVHDTHNVEMACRLWGLRSTDVMQGVVYGTHTDEMEQNPNLATRFDFDEKFGTVINRFCAQAAVDMPLTVYGTGGQCRGLLPLCDSVQCLRLAVENPPELGAYRTLNQFEQTYTIAELAEKVRTIATDLGLNPIIEMVDNPRLESEDHYYRPDHAALPKMGYRPMSSIHREIRIVLTTLLRHTDRIEAHLDALLPTTLWDRNCAPAAAP